MIVQCRTTGRADDGRRRDCGGTWQAEGTKRPMNLAGRAEEPGAAGLENLAGQVGELKGEPTNLARADRRPEGADSA